MSKIKVDYVVIDNARFLEVCRLYHMWKDLNLSIKTWSSRGINLPDVISEQMVCYALDLLWNKGSVGGDATDKNGSLIEIKATSNYDSDLTSFSPKTKFDRLIFFRLDQRQNFADIYDMGINGESLKTLKTNKTQSVLDQQNQGRRPRLRLIETIKELNLKPLCRIDIIGRQIIKY